MALSTENLRRALRAGHSAGHRRHDPYPYRPSEPLSAWVRMDPMLKLLVIAAGVAAVIMAVS